MGRAPRGWKRLATPVGARDVRRTRGKSAPGLSYLLIRRVAIRSEYRAIQFAAEYVAHSWQSLPIRENPTHVRQVQVRDAVRKLEATYLLRLFAEFEAVLQDHLLAVQPQRTAPHRAEHLLNRVASLHRTAPAARDGAHRVRVYRNSLVHRQAFSGETISFLDAPALLNHFLAWLPDTP